MYEFLILEDFEWSILDFIFFHHSASISNVFKKYKLNLWTNFKGAVQMCNKAQYETEGQALLYY